MKKCLLILGRKTVRVSACTLIAAAVCTNKSWAADEVPDEWNAAPMTAGAYLESFGTLPGWAIATGSSLVTATFPDTGLSALPVRTNTWFASTGNVLELSTDGTVLTNALVNSSAGAVGFATENVYVDMRVRFNPMAEPPDAAMLTSCKLAIFVSEDAKLVVAHNGGVTTNTVPLNTNQWYQVSVVMSNSLCDVKLDDVAVSAFTGLTLQNPAGSTPNELAAVSFHGSGYIDELYVSHGDPTYAVEGPTTEITADLPAAGANPPTDEEQTRINVWLSGLSGLTALNMTQDQLSDAYLVNADLTGAAGPVAIDFGISAIDVVSPTSLKITAQLTVASVPQNAAINGRIQLEGKVTKDDSSWTVLDGSITPSAADFTSGEATYFYTIPAGGYKIFKPTIVP